MYSIYLIKANEHKYFGISNNFTERRRRHLRDLKNIKHSNIVLQRCYNKGYSISFLILAKCSSKELAVLIEKGLIKNVECINIAPGGEGGDVISNHPNREQIIAKREATRRRNGIVYSDGFIRQQQKGFGDFLTKKYKCEKCGKIVNGKGNYVRLHGDNCGIKKTVKCPHCGKNGGKGAMIRWHFDNCKFKQ